MRRVLIVVAVCAALLFVFAVTERVRYSGKVMPGVNVEGAAIAGKGERAAYNEISSAAATLETDPIIATAGDVRLVFGPGEVGFEVDEAATVRAARRAGRSRNPIEQTVGFLSRRVRDESIGLVTDWDDELVDELVDRWYALLSDGVREATLEFDGTEVITVRGQAGIGLNRTAARALIVDQLNAPERSAVELPIETVEPVIGDAALRAAAEQAEQLLTEDIVIIANDNFLVLTPEGLARALGTEPRGEELALTIDPELLANELGNDFLRLIDPPVDASFSIQGTSVSVVPHRNGRSPDLDAIIAAILAGAKRIEAPVVDLEPERTTEWAQGLGITELVSTFTTNYPSGQERVTNIHRAAELLDGTVVEPGATFSFNETVGPRTEARGFVSAPVFYGEFTEDFGGGVSQVATTLFNAVFYGGYEDVTHKPHSLYFSRYPRVIEATVNYPTVDLQFRNDTDAGVLIRAGVTSSSITISFYGDNAGRTVRLEGPVVLEEFPVEDEFIPWPLLEVGEEQQIESGQPGFSAEAFRIIEVPGAETIREKFFWRYRMLPNQILRGTSEPTTTTSSTETSSTTAPDASSTTEPSSTTTGATTTTAATTTTTG